MPLSITDKVDITVSEGVANYLSKFDLLSCIVCGVWMLDDEPINDCEEGTTYCSAECQQEGDSLQ